MKKLNFANLEAKLAFDEMLEVSHRISLLHKQFSEMDKAFTEAQGVNFTTFLLNSGPLTFDLDKPTKKPERARRGRPRKEKQPNNEQNPA